MTENEMIMSHDDEMYCLGIELYKQNYSKRERKEFINNLDEQCDYLRHTLIPALLYDLYDKDRYQDTDYISLENKYGLCNRHVIKAQTPV